VFQQPHYSEAFVTSILLSIPEGVEGTPLKGGGVGIGIRLLTTTIIQAPFSSSVAMAGTGIPR